MKEKKMLTSGDEKFDAWLAELDEEELKMFPNSKFGSLVGSTGFECWRDIYEEGLTPLQALERDITD